jgi:hypothetical protein
MIQRVINWINGVKHVDFSKNETIIHASFYYREKLVYVSVVGDFDIAGELLTNWRHQGWEVIVVDDPNVS